MLGGVLLSLGHASEEQLAARLAAELGFMRGLPEVPAAGADAPGTGEASARRAPGLNQLGTDGTFSASNCLLWAENETCAATRLRQSVPADRQRAPADGYTACTDDWAHLECGGWPG